MTQTSSYKRIAVKVGSNVLTRTDGTLDLTRMSALVDQIAQLRSKGIEVILISSGAVACGRSELRNMPLSDLDTVDQRQLFSAVGQAKLMNRYYELFREYGIHVGQVLTLKESFSTERHYQNQRNCMSVMLQNGVLPIINENDTVSITELMFTDNDELRTHRNDDGRTSLVPTQQCRWHLQWCTRSRRFRNHTHRRSRTLTGFVHPNIEISIWQRRHANKVLDCPKDS